MSPDPFAARTSALSGLQATLFENRTALLRFLRARGAGEAAEDLLHELWFRAASVPSGPIGDPLAYLYRSANNLILDLRRSELRARRREQDWTAAGGLLDGDRPETETSDRILIGRQQLAAAEQTLAALGERTETIFRRFRLERQSQRDIAADLGISLSAVEKHLQKAYRALIELRRRFDAE